MRQVDTFLPVCSSADRLVVGVFLTGFGLAAVHRLKQSFFCSMRNRLLLSIAAVGDVVDTSLFGSLFVASVRIC